MKGVGGRWVGSEHEGAVHEMSVALEVCRIAEQYAGSDRLGDVVEVAVEVGDAAGIEIGNLEFCLEALLSAPPFGRGVPRIVRAAGDVLRVESLEIDDGDSDD
jgi:Hydrogenase/urease nickel incorporation, metallochaperone, hypA